MIKQLRMGIKLLRYAYGVKSSMLMGLGVLVIGILMEILDRGNISEFGYNAWIGGYFILLSAMIPLQLLISLNVPAVVAASPWKKRIQTSVFSVSAAVCFLISYLLALGLNFIQWKSGRMTQERFVQEMLIIAVYIILFDLYMAASLKYFVISTILFIIAVMVITGGCQVLDVLGMFSFPRISPAGAAAIGFGSIFLGALLGNGLLRLLYKKPVSKYSQMSGLRKKM